MTENEVSNRLLESIDIIASKRVEQKGYNKTVIGIIVDNTKRENGEYEVTLEGATFKAYSDSGLFNLNDRVYIVVPNGDFAETKFILGKKR